MNHFSYLQIPVNCSLDELNKKYKELAKKCHPDKNGGNTSDFQRLSHSYQEVKKIIEDPIKQFSLRSSLRTDKRKGENITVSSIITFEEYYNGTKLHVFFNRNKVDTTKGRICTNCFGKGIIYVSGMFGPCKICSGAGMFDYLVPKSSSLQLEVPPFFEHSSLLFENEGHHCLNGIQGDLIVNIKIKNNKIYSIKGYDIHTTLNIKLKDALIGYSTLISHPSGELIRYNNEGVIKPGESVVFEGRGLKKDNTYGDFIIDINIVFPDKVSKEAKELISIAI